MSTHRKKVGLKEIASQVGTSIATVSMALSGKGQISDEVTAKIKQVSEEFGYVPTSQKKPKRKNPITVVLYRFDPVRDIIWGYFQEVFKSIQFYMQRAGYETLVLPVSKNTSDDQIYNSLHTIYPDAIFTFSNFSENLKNRLDKLSIRIVVVNDSCPDETYDCVRPDDYQNSYEGAMYLIEQNHRNIAFIEFDSNTRPMDYTQDRFDGFRKALEDNSIPFPDSHHVALNPYDMESLTSVLYPIVHDEKNPVTALFIYDDFLAMQVRHTLEISGVSVPRDISIIAHGDLNNYQRPGYPKISTLQINTEAIGRFAVETMVDLLGKQDDVKSVQTIKVRQKIVDRGSTKKL